jgi:acyl-homoserine-lactone acylase
MKNYFFLLLFPLQLTAQQFSATEIARWQKQSQNVTIIRDNWGIPHV